MKKRLLLLMMPVIFIFASCTKLSKNPSTNIANKSKPEYKISDFYPFKENIRMKYEGIGNEYAEQDVYVDFINISRIQLRVINPGTTACRIIENKNGELRLIKSVGEFYYRDNLTGSKNSKYEILLKEPLKVGNTWALPDGTKRFISRLDAEVSVPYGKFKALEVTTKEKDSVVYSYYVKNLGLVKTLYKFNNGTIETNLIKVESNASVVQTIKFYYPDFANYRLVFVQGKINLKTNDEIKNVFEKYFKSPPGNNISKVMSSSAKINSLYLNTNENKVYIDFSKEFISGVNAGAAMESLILESVTDTLGDYYNVDKVFISVDGKPYTSGHIQINKNGVFYVNYKNIKEYK